MKKVLNFQLAKTTSFGTFRNLTFFWVFNYCFILLFLLSSNLSAQSLKGESDVLSNARYYQHQVGLYAFDQPADLTIEIVTVDGVNLLRYFQPVDEEINLSTLLETQLGKVTPGYYFVIVRQDNVANKVYKLSVFD